MSSLPSDTLPANHRNATNVLLNTLGELESIFAPLFATPSSLSETLAKLDIEKRCQLELMIGYAINTLAFSKSLFLLLHRQPCAWHSDFLQGTNAVTK